MVFNNNSILFMRSIFLLLARLVDQILQQGYQDFQLATSVHHENSGETDRAHSYGIHDERGEKLHHEHNFVRRADRGVQNLVVKRKRQRAH